MSMRSCCYLSPILCRETLPGMIETARTALSGVEFDAFAVSGNSGTLMGGALAFAMSKGLFLVRKPGDQTHSYYAVEGDSRMQTYLFLDDLIDTGATMARVLEGMKLAFPDTKCVGRYLYSSAGYRGE